MSVGTGRGSLKLTVLVQFYSYSTLVLHAILVCLHCHKYLYSVLLFGALVKYSRGNHPLGLLSCMGLCARLPRTYLQSTKYKVLLAQSTLL
jgi:hypothetical protein